MNDAHPPLADEAAGSTRLAQCAVDAGEHRLATLLVESREAGNSLLRQTILVLATAMFGAVAGVALAAGVILLFWDHSPLPATAAFVASPLNLFRRGQAARAGQSSWLSGALRDARLASSLWSVVRARAR